MLNRLPWILVLFRLAAGPAMIGLAVVGRPGLCALLLALGVLSDIFDGIIARRLKVATEALRTWDSRADVVFWISAFAAVAIARPGLIPLLWPAAALIAALEIANHLVSFARFRREASPHHYLSKLFGLGLWALVTQALLTGGALPTLWIVLALGVASQIEAFAITMRLREWRCDVPSVFSLKG